MEPLRKMYKDRKGSILILTLIVMTFLSALALQLGHVLRGENLFIRMCQNDLTALNIARAGLGKAMAAIESDKKESPVDHLEENWIKKFMRDNIPRELPWKDADNRVTGEYAVRIIDESGKININTAGEEELRRLLEAFKGIDRDRLAKEIIDYREQKGKYKTFYSLHELLLVNGMKKSLFLGEDANENGYDDAAESEKGFTPEIDHYDPSVDQGLKGFVTVVTDGKINLNTAPLNVLLSMPGMDKETADAIIDRRRERPFGSLDEVKETSSLSQEAFARIVRWASVRSDWYKVIVQARAQGNPRVKRIVAYIDRSGERAKIKYWREN